MVLDRSQVEAALGRALEIDAVDDDEFFFDVETVQRLADELGVSRAAISQAIGEVTREQSGTLNAVARSTIPAPRSEIDRALDSFFHLRGLQSVGSSVWSQGSGWWPDLYRLTAATPVAVSISSSVEGTAVRLTARLDRVWRAHLFAGLLVPVLLILAWLTSATGMAGAAMWAAVWIGAAGWTFRYRRRAIQRRLAGALADLASPSYRQAPW